MKSSEKTLYKRLVKGPAALKPLAKSFAKRLSSGSVIMLEGILGAGKTTFVRALCKELSVDPSQVRSPSYTLINEYEGTDDNCLTVYHMDLYRLNDASEVNGLGLSEYIEFPDREAISFVEWPDFARGYFDEVAPKLFLVSIQTTGNENERKICITSLK